MFNALARWGASAESMIWRLVVCGILILLLVAWRELPMLMVNHVEFTAEHRRVLEVTLAAWTKYHRPPSMECRQYPYDTQIAVVSIDNSTKHVEVARSIVAKIPEIWPTN